MPAVLVHGVPDTPRMWDKLRARLARSDVVTPSLPGFGAPLPAGFSASKEAYVQWLIAELERAGDRVDLVGHDWGALLVQRVVSLRPDLIRTWACGNGPIDREYVWHDMAQQWQTPDVGEAIMDAMTTKALEQGLAAAMPAEDARAASAHVDDVMKDCILRLYRSAVHVGDEWEEGVAQVTRPALVLWGADDPLRRAPFRRAPGGTGSGRAGLLRGLRPLVAARAACRGSGRARAVLARGSIEAEAGPPNTS